MAERFGCVGVVVDAQPEAIGFYARLGFFELVVEAGALLSRPEPRPMFLPIRSIPGPAQGREGDARP
jgi:hypothetical protein